MRLILLTALWLCLSVTVRGDEDIEEATVTEDLPSEATEETEEIVYTSPTPKGHIYFAEHFDVPEEFEAKWVRSQAKKDGADEEIAKYDGNQSNFTVITLGSLKYNIMSVSNRKMDS